MRVHSQFVHCVLTMDANALRMSEALPTVERQCALTSGCDAGAGIRRTVVDGATSGAGGVGAALVAGGKVLGSRGVTAGRACRAAAAAGVLAAVSHT